MKKAIKSLGICLVCGYAVSTQAGVFDTLSKGLDSVVKTADSAVQKAGAALNVEVNTTTTTSTPETVTIERRATTNSRIVRPNRIQPAARVGGHESEDAAIRMSVDFLKGEFMEKAANLFERDGGKDGDRYRGDVTRLWDRYLKVKPEGAATRVYDGDYEGVPNLIASGGAVLPTTADGAKKWIEAIRAKVREEEAFFDHRDNEIRLAEERKKEAARLAVEASEREEKYVSLYCDLTYLYGTLGDGALTEEAGRISRALSFSRPNEYAETRDLYASIGEGVAALPRSCDKEGAAFERAEKLLSEAKELASRHSQMSKDAVASDLENKAEIAKLHGLNEFFSVCVFADVALGDSLYDVLKERIESEVSVKRIESEVNPLIGETAVAWEKTLDPAFAERPQYEVGNVKLTFGSFSETQELFLVRAQYRPVKTSRLQDAKETFMSRLPNGSEYTEDRTIVGYDVKSLRARNPWAAWQFSYYKNRAEALAKGSQTIAEKNDRLLADVIKRYSVKPFYTTVAVISGAGYVVTLKTEEGADDLAMVTFEDTLSLDAVKKN